MSQVVEDIRLLIGLPVNGHNVGSNPVLSASSKIIRVLSLSSRRSLSSSDIELLVVQFQTWERRRFSSLPQGNGQLPWFVFLSWCRLCIEVWTLQKHCLIVFFANSALSL